MDPFEIDRTHPTHQQRLAKEKQVNIYFIPGEGKDGTPRYAYVVCSSLLHAQFVEAIRAGVIPDFAVIVEEGTGIPPTEEVQYKMLEYYGFAAGEAQSG